MPTTRACPECGATLAGDIPAGACPVCAFRGALALSGAEAQVEVTVSEKPGDQIGRYKLLEKIGEGGYGVVYMAEQTEPIRRRVALKVIKLGMDTKQVIARFEAERQALALMDHPNIAKVLDAGATETGRPYFVMELVQGIRITDYCDENGLSAKDRLDLFIQVCYAIQHAHQKGIIHRDIKPSNILVTLHDGVPVPKVIDFGIAKATEQPLTDQTSLTAFQQFIGTPAYMSPEQAGLTGLDIDTRSDIYALGVLLYELLTGKMPFDAKDLLAAGLDEMRRVIRDQEPPKPSARLSTLEIADLSTTASRRRVAPPALIRLVRGDLDWIVMKCLEKDRTRRYATADALAEDLGHHRNHEPVSAVAPGTWYRVGKFVRRHRAGITIVSAFVLLVTAGVVVSTWQAVRAKRAQQEADTVARFLKDMLNSVSPNVALGRDTTILQDILKKASERVAKELKEQPKVQVELYSIMGNVYLELGQNAKAEEMQRNGLAIAKELHGNEHPDVATSLNDLSMVLEHEGKLGEAEPMQREALAMRKKLLGKEHLEVANSLSNLGLVLRSEGKLPEAEAMEREALAMDKRLLGNEHPDVATVLHNLACVLLDQDKLAEAEAKEREALAVGKKLLGNEHPNIANSLNTLTLVLEHEGKLVEAEALQRQALAMKKKLLGNEHPEVATTLGNLGLVLADEGKLAEAEALHREALAMDKRLLGNEHPNVAISLDNLASVLSYEGKLVESESLHREALAMQKKFLGNESPAIATSLNNLAYVLEHQGKLAEAEPIQREALAMQRKLVGNENMDVSKYLDSLATMLWKQGKLPEAEATHREALALRRKLVGNENVDVSASCNNLALVLEDQGKLAEAESLFCQALAISEKLQPDHSNVAIQIDNLAEVLSKQGKLAETESLLREPLALQKKSLACQNPKIADSLRNLASVLANQGKLAQAEPLYRETLTINQKLWTNNVARFGTNVYDLAEVLQQQGKSGEAEKVFNDVFPVGDLSKPEYADLLRLRGDFRARQGRWSEAAADLAKAAELNPADHWAWYQLAPLLVESGDLDGYRKHRQAMLARFGATNDLAIAERTAKASLLLPVAGADLTAAAKLVEKVISASQDHPWLAYFQFAEGLAEYRRGRFNEAVEWTKKALARPGVFLRDVQAQMVLAMAYQQVHQADQARAELSKGEAIAITKLSKAGSGDFGENYHDWLIAQILMREAASLIEGQPAKANDPRIPSHD
jgi:serine/threonine protein kinase/tetratricopeptide (TPR) repeat protein